MRFEVFVPSEEQDGFDITLKVDAPNWMVALKSGLAKLGSTGTDVRNIVCDIQPDGSVIVTDPKSRRVFTVREIEESVMAPSPVAAKAAALAAPGGAPLPDDGTSTMIDLHIPEALRRDGGTTVPDLRKEAEEAIRQAQHQRATEQRQAMEAQAQADAQATRQAAEAQARAQAEATRKAVAAKAIADAEAARREAEAKAKADAEAARKAEEARRRLEAEQRKVSDAQKRTPSDPIQQVRVLSETRSAANLRTADIARAVAAAHEDSDELLAKVFEEMMDLQLEGPDIAGAAEFALRLATKYIDVESGSVVLADIDKDDLYFAAAVGPKANDVKKFRLKTGQGIAGFSAREGLTLSVSDAPRDPRFYKQISEALRYDNRSILCAPMVYDGRAYGCIELINRRGRSNFGAADLAALSYIATQLGEYLAPRVGRDAWNGLA